MNILTQKTHHFHHFTSTSVRKTSIVRTFTSLAVCFLKGKRGFDAYWTPLFGDGSFAAQLCEAGGDPWLHGHEHGL